MTGEAGRVSTFSSCGKQHGNLLENHETSLPQRLKISKGLISPTGRTMSESRCSFVNLDSEQGE